MQYYTLVASTYGEGTYNSSTYNGQTSTASTGSGSTSSGGGLLSNTGFDVLLAVTVSCVILLVAVLVHTWRRPAKSPKE